MSTLNLPPVSLQQQPRAYIAELHQGSSCCCLHLLPLLLSLCIVHSAAQQPDQQQTFCLFTWLLCSDVKAKAEKRNPYSRHYAFKGRGRKEHLRADVKLDRTELVPARGS